MKKAMGEKTIFEKLDEELLEFHKYLKRKDLDEEDIGMIFEPLLGEKNRGIGRCFFILMSIFLIFHALIRTEIGWWYILAMSRMFLIKIKPFYDWSYLKNEECMIPKWWEKGVEKNYTPNCNFCENLKNVEVLDQLDGGELEEFYMEVQKPVVFQYEFPTVDHVWSSFFQDDNFLSSFPCSIETNVMENEGNIGKILRKISIFPNFFVHFQNCEYDSMKYFRGVVPTPKFVPDNISPVQYNWLMWSRNYTFPRFKKIELSNSENFKLVGQIEGRATYRLLPPGKCEKICEEVEVTLGKGQVFIFTNFWRLEYSVSGSEEEIEDVGVILEAHSIL
ncbi:uncharacterized protein LOC123320835 [Coccinella septempunctata]|uniref:uncharacterized protein LOC123320835 n=1 Tax=Coccinella septempunctata TaxID=41139 RepID=UPI001D074FB4|nr:uncharacterized protein LOC123320835 [Coccinella septempunctata]